MKAEIDRRLSDLVASLEQRAGRAAPDLGSLSDAELDKRVVESLRLLFAEFDRDADGHVVVKDGSTDPLSLFVADWLDSFFAGGRGIRGDLSEAPRPDRDPTIDGTAKGDDQL